MSNDLIAVKLGKVTLQVPLVDDDEKTTRDIAAKITQRLNDIEKASPRIDTQGFALRVAYEYAAKAHALAADLEDANRQFLRALGEMNDRLTGILDAYEKKCLASDSNQPETD